MFDPHYTITNKLLSLIKKIGTLAGELNTQTFPTPVLANLTRSAKSLSSYSSTSIEGNPLPLTEVKILLKSNPENIGISEKEVLNYNQALTDLHKQIKQKDIELSHTLIKNTQKTVTKGLLYGSDRGQYRDKPVILNHPSKRDTSLCLPATYSSFSFLAPLGSICADP